MTRLRSLLPALVTLVAVFGYVGVSAALEGDGQPSDPPPAATCSDGSSTTEATVGTSETAVEDDQGEDCDDQDEVDAPEVDEPDTEAPEVDEHDTEAPETEAPEAPEAAHPDNHGAAVSTAAHECPTGEGQDHGECVSQVAHSDAGKGEKPDEADDDSTEVEAHDGTDVEHDDGGGDAGTHQGDGAEREHGDD